MSPLGKLLLTHCDNNLVVDLAVIVPIAASWQKDAPPNLVDLIKIAAIRLGISFKKTNS